MCKSIYNKHIIYYNALTGVGKYYVSSTNIKLLINNNKHIK